VGEDYHRVDLFAGYFVSDLFHRHVYLFRSLR
jgi:hypothetical protein